MSCQWIALITVAGFAPTSAPASSMTDISSWTPTVSRTRSGLSHNRKSWLFCGSDRGAQRAAAMYSLIITAKMNDVDPQAWLADVLARIATHPAHRLDELLPWNWKAIRARSLAAQAA